MGPHPGDSWRIDLRRRGATYEPPWLTGRVVDLLLQVHHRLRKQGDVVARDAGITGDGVARIRVGRVAARHHAAGDAVLVGALLAGARGDLIDGEGDVRRLIALGPGERTGTAGQ